MHRVIHFEVPADNPERATAFYAKVFGWQAQKWDGPMPYWLIATGKDAPGIDGGIRPRAHPGEGTVNTVDVESVDTAVRAIEKAGGTVTVPKMAIPGIGWLAYATDTEGNMFGVMQNDPEAR